MTVTEAANEAGMKPFTILHHARKGAFFAERLNSQGRPLKIDAPSFRLWLKSRRIAGANKPAKAAIKKGLI